MAGHTLALDGRHGEVAIVVERNLAVGAVDAGHEHDFDFR
jgi:hypothetical protein